MKTIPDTLLLNGIRLSMNDKPAMQAMRNETNDLLVAQVLDFLEEWFDGNETLILQTSGSTGTPKRMKANKSSLVNSASMTNGFFGLNESSRLLLSLSPRFVAGKMMIVRAMLSGAELLTCSIEANPVKNLEENIDFAAMVPLQVAAIVRETPEKFNRIRTIIIGGSGIHPGLEAAINPLKTAFWHTYGMTETLSHIALRPINKPAPSEWFTPLPGIGISTDARGCLCIEAPGLSDEIIVTNDMVEISGSSFKVLGRIDDVIISAGHKIHPPILEKKLGELLHQSFFISSEKHESAGESILLVVEGKPAAREVFALWTSLEKLLQPSEMPRRILYIEQFSYLQSWKVDKATTIK